MQNILEKNIRYFNSHFSFTSLGVTLDRRVSTVANTGIYTFRVQGALYHHLDHLVPGLLELALLGKLIQRGSGKSASKV
jgi:hypothetical protein